MIRPNEQSPEPERPLSLGASILWFVFATALTIFVLKITHWIRPDSDHDIVNAVVCQAAAYVATIWVVLQVHGIERPLSHVMGLRSTHVGFYAIALVLGPCLQVPADLLQRLTMRLWPMSQELVDSTREVLRMDSALSLATIPLATAVVGPLVEEMLYRGVLFGQLRRHYTPRVAVVTVTGLFALAHGSVHVMVPLLFVGGVLTLLRWASGSLWPCLITHASFNGVALMATHVSSMREPSGAVATAADSPWYVSIVGILLSLSLVTGFLVLADRSEMAKQARQEDWS